VKDDLLIEAVTEDEADDAAEKPAGKKPAVEEPAEEKKPTLNREPRRPFD
jgi:hypothetical protein